MPPPGSSEDRAASLGRIAGISREGPRAPKEPTRARRTGNLGHVWREQPVARQYFSKTREGVTRIAPACGSQWPRTDRRYRLSVISESILRLR